MSFMFDHCVKDREQFAHAGNQSYLRRFAGVTQSSVEILDNRVTSTGDQRSHVQRGTNRRASALNGTAASKNPTIPIKRRHTHQGSDLFTIKLPQLRELGKQCATDHWPKCQEHSWADPLSHAKSAFEQCFGPDLYRREPIPLPTTECEHQYVFAQA
jgi:hypothetical protein